jgi:hypothetical protein
LLMGLFAPQANASVGQSGSITLKPIIEDLPWVGVELPVRRKALCSKLTTLRP